RPYDEAGFAGPPAPGAASGLPLLRPRRPAVLPTQPRDPGAAARRDAPTRHGGLLDRHGPLGRAGEDAARLRQQHADARRPRHAVRAGAGPRAAPASRPAPPRALPGGAALREGRARPQGPGDP